MIASTSNEATELASTRSVDFKLLALLVLSGQYPALTTSSNRLALVGLKDHPLNQLVGTNLDGIDILALAQLESSIIARLGAAEKFIVSEILDRNAIDTMATGMDGNFFNGFVIVMIERITAITTVILGDCKFGLRFRLLFLLFARFLFAFTFIISLFFFFLLLLGSNLRAANAIPYALAWIYNKNQQNTWTNPQVVLTGTGATKSSSSSYSSVSSQVPLQYPKYCAAAFCSSVMSFQYQCSQGRSWIAQSSSHLC